jgi:enamine deaminase RidA (YjgF/YER057c/UK114 family)
MGMGGMGGGGFDRPRFEVPELPGPELDGPPDSAAANKLLAFKDDEARRYFDAYTAYMNEVKPQRDSIHEQLNTMDDKLSVGDRAAALFYAERATRISKGLKDRQVRWEEGTLFKILSSDQVKTYKKWKKENEETAQERAKRDAMRWNPMAGGGGGERIEEKTPISAPVGNPSGTSAAVRLGRTIYVAGQVALDQDGNLVGEGDLRAQAIKAFSNLTTVLQAARARPSDVLRLTVYIVNYKPQDLAMIREVGAAYLPQSGPPALTVLGVQSLYREGLLISVEATAVAGGGSPGRGQGGGLR